MVKKISNDKIDNNTDDDLDKNDKNRNDKLITSQEEIIMKRKRSKSVSHIKKGRRVSNLIISKEAESGPGTAY